MDFHCETIIEQLSSRGFLKETWQKDIEKVKSVVPEALSLIPSEWSDEIDSETTISHMGYWRCKQIFEIILKKKKLLKEATTSWLGRYKDPLLYKWDRILRAYRKNNVYFAESVVLLTQNGTYEIPGLKKEISTCESRMRYIQKKISDTTMQINNQRRATEEFCTVRGITGSIPTPDSILNDMNRTMRTTLAPLLNDLHSKLKLPDISQAIEFYRMFATFLNPNSEDDTSRDQVLLLQTLDTLSKYDGRVVNPAELPSLSMNYNDSDVMDQPDISIDAIDWGDLDDNDDDCAAAIDWDIGAEVAAATVQSRDVNDDGNPTSTSGLSNGSQTTEEHNISSCNDMNSPEDGIELDYEDFGIEIAESSIDNVEGDDAPDVNIEHSLVERATREALVNDLLELRYFLEHRREEMQQDEGNTYFSLTRHAPTIIRQATIAGVQKMLHACSTCLASFEAEQLQRLLLLQDSPGAIQRLVETVQGQHKRLDKLEAKVLDFKCIVRDLENDLGKLRPRLDDAVKTTKNVKALLENALGTLLKQPTGVRIVGKINNI